MCTLTHITYTHAARTMAAEQPDDLADAWDKLGH